MIYMNDKVTDYFFNLTRWQFLSCVNSYMSLINYGTALCILFVSMMNTLPASAGTFLISCSASYTVICMVCVDGEPSGDTAKIETYDSDSISIYTPFSYMSAIAGRSDPSVKYQKITIECQPPKPNATYDATDESQRYNHVHVHHVHVGSKPVFVLDMRVLDMWSPAKFESDFLNKLTGKTIVSYICHYLYDILHIYSNAIQQ